MIPLHVSLCLQLLAGITGWLLCLYWKSALMCKTHGNLISEQEAEIKRLRAQVAAIIGTGQAPPG